MLIERSVDGSPLDPNDELFERSSDTSHAEKFLKTHTTAKIIVVIDTHCLESGSFIWTGTDAATYRACTLLEVSVFRNAYHFTSPCPLQILEDCTPEGTFKYLSNKTGTPVHSHKSIILNLACGWSISKPRLRSQMLNG